MGVAEGMIVLILFWKEQEGEMGLFALFNAEKRALMAKKADYENCVTDRKKRLSAFRIKAREYLAFKYPQSVILINNHFPLFLVYDKHGRNVHQGEFADNYSPFLEFVPHDGELEDFQQSILNYRTQVGEWQKGKLVNHHQCSKDEQRNWAGGFNRNGFNLKDSYRYDDAIKAADFFGFSVFLNGELIAQRSIWQYQPSGYFAEQMYRKILNPQHRSHTGYSMISFVAGVFTLASETNIGCVNHNRIQYEIVFGNGDRLNDDKNLSDAKQGIFALRDFLCELENQLRADRSEDDWGSDHLSAEDKRECETLLANPNRKSRFPGIDEMYVR